MTVNFGQRGEKVGAGGVMTPASKVGFAIARPRSGRIDVPLPHEVLHGLRALAALIATGECSLRST